MKGTHDERATADHQTRIIGALIEGNNIRATERMPGIHRDAIMRLGVKVGEACGNLQKHIMHDIQVSTIAVDEQWEFIYKKAKHVTREDAPELGDVWLFTALAACTRRCARLRDGTRDHALHWVDCRADRCGARRADGADDSAGTAGNASAKTPPASA